MITLVESKGIGQRSGIKRGHNTGRWGNRGLDKFSFYLEFDGKKAHSKAYDSPIEQIMAMGIKQAIERFCKRMNLDCTLYEALSKTTYRTYLVKKQLLKGLTEYAYYIEQERA